MLKLFGHGARRLLALHGISNSIRYYSSSPLRSKLSSSSSSSHLVVEYLIKSLEFSRDEAISAAKKLRCFKSNANPDSVLEMLKRNGFDDAQIKEIAASSPRILSMNADKTLAPKIRVLRELGLTNPELVKIRALKVGIMRSGLRSAILPAIKTIRSILGSDENVAKVIKRSVSVLGNRKYLEQNIQLLRSRGMNDDRIGKLMVLSPRVFCCSTKWLERTVNRVESMLGFDGDSAMFVFGIFALQSVTDEKFESKFGIFKSYGWDENDIMIMARGNPIIFTVSDAKIKRGLHFFMEELGYDPRFLAEHPSLLMFSMERRIRPRIAVLQVLKDKKLIKESHNIYAAFSKKESEFMHKFIEPYKLLVPYIYDVYSNNMRAPAKAVLSRSSFRF
ncbi:hypothetical protein Droror1_Dr00009399 [Drosera rotundifolia]